MALSFKKEIVSLPITLHVKKGRVKLFSKLLLSLFTYSESKTPIPSKVIKVFMDCLINNEDGLIDKVKVKETIENWVKEIYALLIKTDGYDFSYKIPKIIPKPNSNPNSPPDLRHLEDTDEYSYRKQASLEDMITMALEELLLDLKNEPLLNNDKRSCAVYIYDLTAKYLMQGVLKKHQYSAYKRYVVSSAITYKMGYAVTMKNKLKGPSHPELWNSVREILDNHTGKKRVRKKK